MFVASLTPLNMLSVALMELSQLCIRYNDIRDLTAELMSEVCHDVSKELSLQPLNGEPLSFRTCNRDDGARLDIKAFCFWGGQFQSSFFDVRIFNPFAPI